MEEDLKFIFDSAKEGMENAMERLEHELARIRAGKASPAMLTSVQVEYYGSNVPLKNVANVNTPDSKTLMIQPFERVGYQIPKSSSIWMAIDGLVVSLQ